MTIPTSMTSSGLQPQQPSDLWAQIISIAASLSPGYTANLPGSLIDDITGTDTAALSLMDQMRVELINSVSPYAANQQLLISLGNIYGVQQGSATNTSVYVTFSGTVGYVIPIGFTVSDGNYQYSVQDGGVIGAAGTSSPLYCLATQSGSWAVPAGTVTSIASSVSTGYTVTCTNLTNGTPSSGAQTTESFRAEVLNAGKVISTGMQSMLRSQLGFVSGVQNNLISIAQQTPLWKVIVGGGDPYQIGWAIYTAMGPGINMLTGSVMAVSGITNANPGVVTTSLNHGFGANGAVLSSFNGSPIQINGATGISGINGVNLTITIISQTSFSIGINTTSSGTYTGNGVLTPNPRNQNVSLIDGLDVYQIPFVLPPQQNVSILLTWNYIGSNSISATSVTLQAAPALAGYINSIQVGQPINLFALQETFVSSISSMIPSNLIDRMVFSVYINGILTAPASGTGAISGDPESYFYTVSSNITITQG